MIYRRHSIHCHLRSRQSFGSISARGTTVINAAIRPVVSRYLDNIRSRVRGTGVTGQLLVMQSSGGVLTFEAAIDRPVFMVESGPAAGVIAASNLGIALGHENVISFDMGGTTAKAGLIENGTPRVTKEYEVGGTAATTEHGSRGSGYPIRTPVIDLVEIGAGGGSIAWIDSGGILRVGPRSAGADPGPVCYGLGGKRSNHHRCKLGFGPDIGRLLLGR